MDGVDMIDGWNEADALDRWMGWKTQVLQGRAKSWLCLDPAFGKDQGSKSSFTRHRASESPTQTVNVHQ